MPWEFFHTIFWHWEGWPTNPAPPTTFQITAMAVGWLAIGWIAVSLFVGTRRGPYDSVAGTVVISKSKTLAVKGE